MHTINCKVSMWIKSLIHGCSAPHHGVTQWAYNLVISLMRIHGFFSRNGSSTDIAEAQYDSITIAAEGLVVRGEKNEESKAIPVPSKPVPEPPMEKCPAYVPSTTTDEEVAFYENVNCSTV